MIVVLIFGSFHWFSLHLSLLFSYIPTFVLSGADARDLLIEQLGPGVMMLWQIPRVITLAPESWSWSWSMASTYLIALLIYFWCCQSLSLAVAP